MDSVQEAAGLTRNAWTKVDRVSPLLCSLRTLLSPHLTSLSPSSVVLLHLKVFYSKQSTFLPWKEEAENLVLVLVLVWAMNTWDYCH